MIQKESFLFFNHNPLLGINQYECFFYHIDIDFLNFESRFTLLEKIIACDPRPKVELVKQPKNRTI